MTRNANLILDKTAQPANGVQYANVTLWYGGAFEAILTGVFGGATVEVVVCPTIPNKTDVQSYGDVMTNDDWVTLAALTAPGRVTEETLNPCLVTTKVTASGATTRVKGIIS